MDNVVLPGLPEGMELGKQIKVARVMRGIRQADLAKQVGLTPGGLAKIEAGETQGRVGTIESIFNVLGYQFRIYLPDGQVLAGWRDPRTPQLIRNRRLALGLYQRELGKLAGVAESTVQNVENGYSDAGDSTLLAILKALWDHQVRVVLEPVDE